jgi:hypothetical protein
MYTKKDDEKDKDKCTVALVDGPNGAVEVVKKESIYQKILFNFYIQQQAQEELKETGVLVAADVAAEGLFDWFT